jgi:hypothetical protein
LRSSQPRASRTAVRCSGTWAVQSGGRHWGHRKKHAVLLQILLTFQSSTMAGWEHSLRRYWRARSTWPPPPPPPPPPSSWFRFLIAAAASVIAEDWDCWKSSYRRALRWRIECGSARMTDHGRGIDERTMRIN